MRVPPLLSVELIASSSAAQSGGAAGKGMNQLPPPTGHIKATCCLYVGVMLKNVDNADTGHYTAAIKGSAMSVAPFDRCRPPYHQ